MEDEDAARRLHVAGCIHFREALYVGVQERVFDKHLVRWDAGVVGEDAIGTGGLEDADVGLRLRREQVIEDVRVVGGVKTRARHEQVAEVRRVFEHRHDGTELGQWPGGEGPAKFQLRGVSRGQFGGFEHGMATLGLSQRHDLRAGVCVGDVSRGSDAIEQPVCFALADHVRVDAGVPSPS